MDQVAEEVAAADVAHFDETGFRAEGKLYWLHSAPTAAFTHLSAHANRGRKGMDAAGIVPHFTGIAVHDAWAPMTAIPSCATSCAPPTSYGS